MPDARYRMQDARCQMQPANDGSLFATILVHNDSLPRRGNGSVAKIIYCPIGAKGRVELSNE